MKSKSKPSLLPRLRIVSAQTIAFGPGKAKLLELISQTGAIGEAAKRMGMSYMRAWSLVQEMNRCFRSPLVEAARGGHKHGGAELTEIGRCVLKLYQRMEKDSLKAAQSDWSAFQKLMH
jgi:molybdate transport system regulatory protein